MRIKLTTPINCLGWTGERISITDEKITIQTYEAKWKRYRTVTSFPIIEERTIFFNNFVIHRYISDKIEIIGFYDWKKHILSGKTDGLLFVKSLVIDEITSISEIMKRS